MMVTSLSKPLNVRAANPGVVAQAIRKYRLCLIHCERYSWGLNHNRAQFPEGGKWVHHVEGCEWAESDRK